MIHRNDTASQIEFLIKNHIGLTDLLSEIDDADINNPEHVKRIVSYKDDQIERFESLVWNTPYITDYIHEQEIEAVYFTRLGGAGKFGEQMAIIENYCQVNGVYCKRLLTPSGQGLGEGKPRRHKLIHKWFSDNGADGFPFLSQTFNVLNFPWQ